MANTSVATVSRALNGKPGVSDQHRTRILELVQQLGYTPNRGARNLALQRSHVLGFVASDLHNPVYVDFIRYVEAECRARGYQILIADSEQRAEREKQNIHIMLEHRAEGLLVFPVSEYHSSTAVDHLISLRHQRIPFAVAGDMEAYGFDSVVADEEKVGYDLCKHLIGLGHERINMIGLIPNSLTALRRCQGAARALREHGLLPESDDPLFAVHQGISHLEPGWLDRLHKHLTGPKRPTGLITVHEVVALYLYRPLAAWGFRMPDDLSLVSVGSAYWVDHVQPALTTASIDETARAHLALTMLFERMREPDKPPMHHRLEYLITPRESAGPPLSRKRRTLSLQVNK